MAYQQHPGQQQQYYPPPPPGQPQQGGYAPPVPQHPQQYQQPPQQYQQPPQQYQQPPQQQHQQQPAQGGPSANDSGAFPGGHYTITHRNTNAILTLTLQKDAPIRSKPGAMIHMSGDMRLTGKVKFSMKGLFTGSDLSESTFTGPGRVALGPTLFGDIITLHVDANSPPWTMGKDAFLACTQEVTKDTKAQGFSKSLFSGEDIFVYRLGGRGTIWLTSFGAVERLDLAPKEQHVVDNGHLVAWNCGYQIEKAGGGSMASLKTGEGLVCRFTGPGSIYIQTRNKDEFDSYIYSHSRGSQN